MLNVVLHLAMSRREVPLPPPLSGKKGSFEGYYYVYARQYNTGLWHLVDKLRSIEFEIEAVMLYWLLGPYSVLGRSRTLLFIIPFQALRIGSYCADAAPITPSCIMNLRSSRIALCSTILSSAILEICAAWYEKLLPVGGMPKKSPVCLPVIIIIDTTLSFEAILSCSS